MMAILSDLRHFAKPQVNATDGILGTHTLDTVKNAAPRASAA